MYTADELRDRYTQQPRNMDAYLRKLTYIDTGVDKPFPALKLLLATAAFVAGTYYYSTLTETNLQTAAMVSLALYMGVAIQIVRAASQTEHNVRLIKRAHLSTARVFEGDNQLFQQGGEPGKATVLFSLCDDNRHGSAYLKDVTKKLRAAYQKRDDESLSQAFDLVSGASTAAAPLPKSLASDGQTWVARIEVIPDRLPDERIVNQQLLVLSVPEHNFVAHL